MAWRLVEINPTITPTCAIHQSQSKSIPKGTYRDLALGREVTKLAHSECPRALVESTGYEVHS